MIKNNIICLTPVFNDWESLSFLISEIEKEALKNKDYCFSLIVINDGSTQLQKRRIDSKSIKIEIVNLKLNIGHQRAIAVGIQFIFSEYIKSFQEFETNGHVVVLDGDGEDKPSDIIHMVTEAKDMIVFAKRVKRSEGTGFKTGYFLYKRIFRLLTGKNINFGNFSAIPFSLLNQVAILPNLWNHYASSIAESKIAQKAYPTERGYRYAGKSKMNVTSLIIHGFSSISIYFDILCFRVLKFSFISILLCSIGILYVLFQKLFTDNAIPGWASSLILIVLSIVIQLFSVTFIILLMQLRSRKEISPPDDTLYLKFIDKK
ncbi:glycosyltransferase [Mariniflexile soesokkakense]|uniref:Glycosyltransferase n=1 Tax=Mariniflexile soesokkakense TaxID=1343160 RepID=A0ABV0A9N4_9FLAO